MSERTGLVSASVLALALIIAPPDLATSIAAYACYAELHARLEPLLTQPTTFAYDVIMRIDPRGPPAPPRSRRMP